MDWGPVLAIDLPAATAALLATLACALVGNFLVLRRQSLMGDAISHAVLPGIVVAFLVVGAASAVAMFVGALAAAILAAVLIALVRRYGRLESGAAMGVVFSILFAAGVVLIEQGAARNVDLDADCVLYGQLEDILWLAAATPSDLLRLETWAQIPREVATLAVVLALVAGGVALFWKELAVASFDPELATALGFRAARIDLGLMVAVGAVAVAAFEAVGSILVIAMFICPPAAARLFADRLGAQVGLSLAFAALAAIGGYVAAVAGPGLVGASGALSASGTIAVAAGAILAASALLAPRHGVLARRGRAAASPM